MNADLSSKIVKILPHNSTLRKGDFCRLVVQTGDEGGFNTTYKPDGYRPLMWQPVEEEMPAWVNEEIQLFPYHVWYEYARVIEG